MEKKQDKENPIGFVDESIIHPADLLKYINDTPDILSLLYDLNLLPEQTLHLRDQKSFMYGMAFMHKMMTERELRKKESEKR